MHFRFALLLIVLLNTALVYSQSSVIIQGLIVNSETKAPVAFANVYDGTVCTASNQVGQFILYLGDHQVDSLTISCIGYETQKVLAAARKEANVFYLKPKVEELNEVVVLSTSPEKIMRKALKRLPWNFENPLYSAKFALNQYISDEDGNLLGHCVTYGVLRNKYLDTTKYFPRIQIDSVIVTQGFVDLDNPFKGLYGMLAGFDSFRLNSLHQLSPYYLIETAHPILRVCGKEPYDTFFESADFTLKGIQKSNGYDQFVIHSKTKLPENKVGVFPINSGYFTINKKDFAIENAVSKWRTKLLVKEPAKLPNQTPMNPQPFISCSYQKFGKKYCLTNIDYVITRSSSIETPRKRNVYFSSMQLTDIKLKHLDQVRPIFLHSKEAHYKIFNNTRIIPDQKTDSTWDIIKRSPFLVAEKN